MAAALPLGYSRPFLVRLPCSSKRGCTGAHLMLLDSVRPLRKSDGVLFDGKLLSPGAMIDESILGEQPVLLEYAGPIGDYQRSKKRPHLWVLWTYDFSSKDWKEIARAQGYSQEWTAVLAPAAIRAMAQPKPEEEDAAVRSQQLAADLEFLLEEKLKAEPDQVRIAAMQLLRQSLARRIIEADE